MKYWPLKSVVIPISVPSKKTFTKGIASPVFISVITPRIVVVCAKAFVAPNKKNNESNKTGNKFFNLILCIEYKTL